MKSKWSPSSAEKREQKKVNIPRLVAMVRQYPCRSAAWYSDKLNLNFCVVAAWLRELVRTGILRNDQGGWEARPSLSDK